MFLLNQIGTESIRVETINKIVAENPRYDERIPPEANAKKCPLVIALTEHGEEILGEYESIADCKVAINFVSFLLNHSTGTINMPKKNEARMLANKIGEIKTKNTSDLAKDILKVITSTFPDQKGGIR